MNWSTSIQYLPVERDTEKTTTHKTFTHPHSGKSFSVTGVISCNTKHPIYMLKCPWGLSFVGNTSRAGREKTRIPQHRCATHNNETSPTAVHFKRAQHNISTLRYTDTDAVRQRGSDTGPHLSNEHTPEQRVYAHFQAQISIYQFEREHRVRLNLTPGLTLFTHIWNAAV